MVVKGALNFEPPDTVPPVLERDRELIKLGSLLPRGTCWTSLQTTSLWLWSLQKWMKKHRRKLFLETCVKLGRLMVTSNIGMLASNSITMPKHAKSIYVGYPFKKINHFGQFETSPWSWGNLHPVTYIFGRNMKHIHDISEPYCWSMCSKSRASNALASSTPGQTLLRSAWGQSVLHCNCAEMLLPCVWTRVISRSLRQTTEVCLEDVLF